MRARVDEGSGTCKRFNPAWHGGRHHQRRRGGAVRRHVPPRLEGRGVHKGREVFVLTLVATGRSAGVGEVRWRGSSAGRKTKATAARRRASRGSRGGRCARQRRVRLLPRAAPVFAADDAPTDGSNSSFSPLHFSFSSGGSVGGQGSDSPEAARAGSSPGVSAAALIAVSNAGHVDGRDEPGGTGHAATARPRPTRPLLLWPSARAAKVGDDDGDVIAAPGNAVRVPLASDRGAARRYVEAGGFAAGPRPGWKGCWARMEVGGPLRIEVISL
jgi:hypothetical protein